MFKKNCSQVKKMVRLCSPLVKEVLVLVGMMVLGSSLVFAQPKEKLELPEQASEKAKIKVEKVWEMKFDEEIEDISVTDDGERILVYLKNGDGVYLDKSGKVLKEQKGKRGKVVKNGMFISYDGEILDNNGEIVNKIALGPPDIEYPIFSPTGKYFAIVPGYDADFPFIRVYNTITGKLLWSSQEGEAGKIIPKFLTAEFVDNEKIVIYKEDLSEGIIGLNEVNSGRKIWETILFEKSQNERIGDYFPISTAKSGQMVLYHHDKNMLFSIDTDGKILWRKKCKGGKISANGSYVFLYEDKNFSMIENKTERKIWSKIGNAAQVFFTPDERKVFLMAHLPDKDRVIKKDFQFREGSTIRDWEERSFYIFDVQNGDYLERRTDIDVPIQVLDRGFITKQKNTLLKFNIEE